MKGSKTIRISTIHYFEHFVILIKILLGKCQDLNNFSPVALIHLGPIVHLDFLDVLLSVFLLLRLFALARVAFDRLTHLVWLRILRASAEI
jgi:hypothetical protein